MRYYRLRQDPTMAHAIFLENMDSHIQAEPDSLSFVYLRRQPVQDYIDFLTGPLPLVSDTFKSILKQHSPPTQFTQVVLIDPDSIRQTLYWFIQPPLIDCLSSHTVCDNGNSITSLVLAQTKLPPLGLFSVQGLQEPCPCLIVNLAATESILRRYPRGLVLERIEVREE